MPMSDLTARLSASEDYWVQRLSNLEPITLPFLRPDKQPDPAAALTVRPVLLPDVLTVFLNSSSFAGTLRSLALTVFVVYLSRISGSRTFDIGFQSSILRQLLQQYPELGTVAAPSVPLHVKINLNLPFSSIYAGLQQQVNQVAQRFTYLRDIGERHPHLHSSTAPLAIGIVQAEQLDSATLPGHVLALVLADDAVGWAYNPALLSPERAERMQAQYETLLYNTVLQQNRSPADLSMLPASERRTVLHKWNATTRDYPYEQCLHWLVEAQVSRTPDAVAVVFEGQSLPYAELNHRANQVAHYLRSLGVGPDHLVGICMERSLEMVIGLLGILKADGAYVPLDPELPYERLAFMLDDTEVDILLTQQHLLPNLPPRCATRSVWMMPPRRSAATRQATRCTTPNQPYGVCHLYLWLDG
ncbi:MAG: AMP-binding protein [Chloroflexaceae bacterium]|nr:AMP-binding protein [Chloroflexaceae bacterium]